MFKIYKNIFKEIKIKTRCNFSLNQISRFKILFLITNKSALRQLLSYKGRSINW